MAGRRRHGPPGSDPLGPTLAELTELDRERRIELCLHGLGMDEGA